MKTARIIPFAIALAVSICITGGLVYAANVLKHETPQHDPPPPFAPDQVVVAFKPGTPGEAKRAAHAQAGGRVIHALDAIDAHLVGIPSGTLPDKIAVYKRNPNVRYAEPNYYRTLAEPPTEGYDPFVCSDYYWDEQWGLHNTGQGLLDPTTGGCTITGADDADIDWLDVWESGVRGRGSIKIAIVDTGVECTHPDLVTECVETWVATDISEGPEDLIGHGTHVAGIAAAATGNGVGIAGVGIDAKVGSLKACQCYPGPGFLCLTGICEDWDTAEAILHAKAEGYHVINMSFGGTEVSDTLKNAVDEAIAAGVVLVSSAGNAYSLEEPSYPAAYDGVIAVAATDHYDNLASFSNFGQWVEVAAPGVNSFSTYPAAGCGDPDCYTWMSGTSMASPVVAGAAALVWDSIGGVDPIVPTVSSRDNVINAILNNADRTGALGQYMLAWTRHGRLNLHAALNGGGENIPPTVHITSPENGAAFNEGADITITATADDLDGTVTQVEFFQETTSGTTSLGTDADSPYSVTWSTVTAGDYELTAAATDDGGATTTSGAISITVNSTGGGCTTPAWDPGASYVKGDIVSHNDHEWRAKNASQGVAPGTSNRYWADSGACGL